MLFSPILNYSSIFIMEKQYYLTEPNCELSSQLKIKNPNHQYHRFTLGRSNTNKKPIINQQLNEQYYQNKYLKPGINIYRVIIEAYLSKTQTNEKLPLLQINIPKTLIFYENNYYMVKTKNGVVQVDEEINYNNVFQIFGVWRGTSIRPCLTIMVGNGMDFEKQLLMSNELSMLKIFGKSENQVTTEYIMPYGLQPNIFRLFYYPQTNNINKASYGCKIVNKCSLSEQLFQTKNKMQNKYFVAIGRQETWSLNIIKGKALKEPQMMAESLVKYLQVVKKATIYQIVIDFAIDQEKKIWFQAIKSIKSKNLTKIWDIGSPHQIQLIVNQKINSQVTCSLCQISYCKTDMSRLVTNKLIFELLQHLKLRGQKISQISFNQHQKPQGYAHVCSLCYDLIVAEHHLINIEKQFCKILNLTNQNQYSNQNTYNHSLQFQYKTPKTLHQWRLLVYIQNVKNILNIESKTDKAELQMVFAGKTTKFLKQGKREQLKYSKAAVSTRNTQSSRILNRIPQQSKTNVFFNKVKMFMFYSPTQNLQKFLFDAKIFFNLKLGNERYEGSSSTLSSLHNKPNCQRHSSEVFLFNQKYKYCNLQLTVGLVCDGVFDINTSNLQLVDHVYFPRQITRTCEPVPQEWIQLFIDAEKYQNKIKSIHNILTDPSYLFSSLNCKVS